MIQSKFGQDWSNIQDFGVFYFLAWLWKTRYPSASTGVHPSSLDTEVSKKPDENNIFSLQFFIFEKMPGEMLQSISNRLSMFLPAS